MTSRAKLVAFSTGALSLAVLAAALVAGRERISGAWHLYRLETGDLEVAAAAARELGRRRCVRAAGPIVRAMRRLLDTRTIQNPDFFFVGPAQIGPGTEPEDLPAGYERLELLRCLQCIGKAAIPGLLEVISDRDAMTRRLAANAVLLEISEAPFGTWIHMRCLTLQEL
ncbi:MAG: hypothetical protein HY721_15840, partial [Planctomycetes bacterium]|nr:hypothetical protein [Planctomycetota bacterium]